MRTIFRTIFGSHLYGTNTPQSDTDYKSIHIPDARDILLQRVQDSVTVVAKRTKADNERNLPEDTDHESYSLQRYLYLLAEGQTMAIDMLFSPSPAIASNTWGYIKSHKDKLVTKKSASFVGYCRTQANKYGIKGSRVAAAKEAMEIFYSAIQNYGHTAKVLELDGKLPVGTHARVVEKETTPGKFETYYDCCNRMVGFKNTVKEAYSIYSRIHEEYGKRAKLAESNEGIDWKALSHAVRVGNEAVELLETGNVTFPLENRKRILEIKLGNVPYKEVAEDIEKLLEEVEAASKVSSLREEPDYEFIDQYVFEEHEYEVRRKWL